MFQFSDLYGSELTRELGSADTANLFTVARRQAAINAGQLEFVKRTECSVDEASVAIVAAQGEYSLEGAAANFGLIAKRGVSMQITDANNNVRYVEGDALIQASPERLNEEQPGWRAAPAGTPTNYYIKRKAGQLLLGFTPAPGPAVGETWVAIVPYVIVPAPLVNDTDLLFTYGGHTLASMQFWYRAVVHYAAYDAEKYRKDTARGSAQLQLFEDQVQKFSIADKPKGGRRVRFVRDYRGDARRPSGLPRRFSVRQYP